MFITSSFVTSNLGGWIVESWYIHDVSDLVSWRAFDCPSMTVLDLDSRVRKIHPNAFDMNETTVDRRDETSTLAIYVFLQGSMR